MSQFGADKFTTRAREAIEAAQLAATTAGNSNTEPIHLLVALLKQEDGTSRSLVQKAGVDPAPLLARAEGVQQQLPRATGSTVQQPSASSALTRVLAQALDLAASMKDDYVATDHLLVAIATVESPAQNRQMAHWLRVVEGKEEPMVLPAETLNIQKIIDAAYRSAAEGREVEIGE